MNDVLAVLAVVAVVAYVIVRQLKGEPIRGKRLIVLPAVLVLIGIMDLTSARPHPAVIDIFFLAISALITAGIGAGQGLMMHLEPRLGALWGKMPARGLWLWAALIAARVGLDVIASAAGAHVAASSTAILLMLGINRLAQAAVITSRALAAGIPFAPEKDGRGVLSGASGSRRSAASMPMPPSRTVPPSAPYRRSQDDQGRNPQRTGRHAAGSSRMPRPSTAADSATSARRAATSAAAGGAGDLARPASGGRGSGHGRGAHISARAPWRSRHRQEPE
jgi:hypothetical protein